MKILGIVGSLRRGSYNRQLMHKVADLLPEGVEMVELEYADVPIFNQDYEFPTPESVVRVRQAVKEADGIMFFVPEYTQGIPGALKNLVDWISRPVSFETMEKVLVGKPVGMMGAALGFSGTLTAQENLRSYLTFMNVNVMPQPRVTIAAVHTMMNEQGHLEFNPITQGFVEQTTNAFVDFVNKHTNK